MPASGSMNARSAMRCSNHNRGTAACTVPTAPCPARRFRSKAPAIVVTLGLNEHAGLHRSRRARDVIPFPRVVGGSHHVEHGLQRKCVLARGDLTAFFRKANVDAYSHGFDRQPRLSLCTGGLGTRVRRRVTSADLLCPLLDPHSNAWLRPSIPTFRPCPPMGFGSVRLTVPPLPE